MSLAAMRQAIRDAETALRMERKAWDKDKGAKAALRHHLASIGAAAHRVPTTLRSKDPAIPWKALEEFPALLSEPWGVTDDAVRVTAEALPAIRSKIEALLGIGGDPGVA